VIFALAWWIALGLAGLTLCIRWTREDPNLEYVLEMPGGVAVLLTVAAILGPTMLWCAAEMWWKAPPKERR
jgi:hypothetical protein